MDKFTETVTGWLLAAALVGGLVGLRQHKNSISGPIDGLVFLLTGFACAIFGAPLAAQWFGITGEREIAGLGFIIAILWMPIYSRLSGVVSGGDIALPGGPHG
ncbi:TPA: hypothetical protein RUT42_003440 [Escherichia coli]|nr:hypothetical protein [Escherichia coli]